MMDATKWTSEARMSQLCKPLSAVLRDTSSLSMLEYFIQFMESIGALHLVQFWLSVESFKSAGHGTSYSRDCDPCDNTCHGSTSISTGLGKPMHHVQSPNTVRNDMNMSGYLSGHTQLADKQPTTSHEEFGFTTSQSLGTRVHLDIGNHADDESGCVSRNVCHSSGKTESTGVGDLVQSQSSSAPCLAGEGLSRQKSLTVVTDAIGIYTTYIALNALSPLDIPDEIRQRVEVNICPEDGIVDRSCFSEAQAFIYDIMRTRYYPKFLQSSTLCKFQLEYISSGELKLLDFLLGDTTLFYFMEYMEQEKASPLLQFWLTAESFYTNLSTPSHAPNTETAMADAITIYERYFSLQASEQLGLGDSVRLDVENKICDEHGPRMDSFAVPQKMAYEIMNKTYYPNFLESSIYLQFLNELVHTLKDSPLPNIGSEIDSVSVCDHESCQTDLEQDLDDPDSLWKRTTQLPLRLGYVDEFGQYISEVDSTPQVVSHRHGGKRKYFWQQRSRKQEEEMAMKISRKIITEVLNTMSHVA